ncbi:MAG: FAD:protein FMN transferase, partial [Candidatus Saccharicenans sp.]
MDKKTIHHFSYPAMGTFFELFIAGQNEDYNWSAAQAFFKEIDRLESFLSSFDQRSEISRINRLKPGELLPIGFETYECLRLSFELMASTGGAFNINYLAIKFSSFPEMVKERLKREEILAEKTEILERSRKEGRLGLGPETGRKKVEGDAAEDKDIEKIEIEGQRFISGENHYKLRKVRAKGLNQWNLITAKPESEARRKTWSMSIAAEVQSDLDFWRKLFPLELIETESGFVAYRLDVPEAGLNLDLGAIG